MAYEPDDGLRQALTTIDIGEADLIVTADAEAAGWAAATGYRVVEAEQDGMPIFEIRSGDREAV